MKKLTFTVLSLMCMQLVFAYEMKDEVILEPYCGDEITIEAQPETGYHFLNWSDGVTSATRTFTPNQDSTLIANFGIDTCIVYFYNSDNTLLKKDTLVYGTNVSNSQPDESVLIIPESQKEDGHSYAFNGWSPTLTPDYTVPEKTTTLTYTATYSDTKLKYDIHFVNWDNTPIVDINLEYGATLDTCTRVPGYDGTNTPTKVENDTCTFVFKGWSPELSTVTGEKTYVAVYDTIYKLFTVDVRIDPAYGDVSKTQGNYEGKYHYGDIVEITVSNIDACYEFVNWIETGTTTQFTNEVTYSFPVHGNLDLTAILERIKFTITIKSNNSSEGKVGGKVKSIP